MGGIEMKKEEKLNAPTFVYCDRSIADKVYVEWLTELKQRFQQSQIKAAVRVNTAMLEFYWSLGRDIVALKAESKWGSGFFNQLSLDMRAMFPEETGFSSANLRYMKRWYEFYYQQVTNLHHVVEEIVQRPVEEIFQRPVEELSFQSDRILKDSPLSILQRPVEELKMPELFGRIPWGQHIEIFTKCKSLEEALFYINKTIENNWSRPSLETQITFGLYYKQGSAITNFDRTLPAPQSQLAKELLKDEYNLSFISAEAVQEEKDLENALASNVTQFLLELGKGFAYLGRQQELRIDDESVFFPDLLFYHIPQRRYVIIELKAVKFMPEFAGKLNFYVTAADKLLRGKDDNPSVGLLICKTAKKTIVEWSLQDIQKPLGVATYQLQEVVDRTVAELELRKKQKEEMK